VDALTPSERRVALLAAEGLTPRDRAGAPHATRTVELHLSAAYRKLEVP
jgi:DNA-binding CsgD family transcriptional regulator